MTSDIGSKFINHMQFFLIQNLVFEIAVIWIQNDPKFTLCLVIVTIVIALLSSILNHSFEITVIYCLPHECCIMYILKISQGTIYFSFIHLAPYYWIFFITMLSLHNFLNFFETPGSPNTSGK